MPSITLRPNAVLDEGGGWFLSSGGNHFSGAEWADNNPVTGYATTVFSPSSPGGTDAKLAWADPSPALNSNVVISSVTPRVDVRASGTAQVKFRLGVGGSIEAGYETFSAISPHSIVSGAARTTRPDGAAWTAADIINANIGFTWLTGAGTSAIEYLEAFLDIVYQSPPDVPASLQQFTDPTVTTPTFQTVVTDADANTVKARYEIYQSDGITLIATVDSSLVASGSAAQATYGTPLSVGQYKVRAKAIDSTGLESAWTSLLTFQILTAVVRDRIYLWNTLQLSGAKDLTALWNVVANNSKTMGLLWNVLTNVVKDTKFNWNVQNVWVDADPMVGSEWGGKQPRNSDIWTTVEP